MNNEDPKFYEYYGTNTDTGYWKDQLNASRRVYYKGKLYDIDNDNFIQGIDNFFDGWAGKVDLRDSQGNVITVDRSELNNAALFDYSNIDPEGKVVLDNNYDVDGKVLEDATNGKFGDTTGTISKGNINDYSVVSDINKYDLTKNSSFVANIDGTDREYTVTQSTDGYQFTGKDANGNQVTYTVKYDAKGNGKVYDSNNRVVKNDIPTIRENPTQINENTPVITNTTAAERNRERVAMEIHKLDQLNDTNVPTNSNITLSLNINGKDRNVLVSNLGGNNYRMYDAKTGETFIYNSQSKTMQNAKTNKTTTFENDVNIHATRVDGIDDLYTNTNGIDTSVGARFEGTLTLGGVGDNVRTDDYTIVSKGGGKYDFIDSKGKSHEVVIDGSKVTFDDQDISGKYNLNIKKEQDLWNPEYVKNPTNRVTNGGITDLNTLGNYYYNQNVKNGNTTTSFNNMGAVESITDYNGLQVQVHNTRANVHDYGTPTGKGPIQFNSVNDAALALARNGTFSYTEAKNIVASQMAAGSSDFTVTDFGGNSVEYFLKNTFITDYDQTWKDLVDDSKNDVIYTKEVFTAKMESIKQLCSKALTDINGYIQEELKGHAASEALSALQCVKGKIENLYNNVTSKLSSAIEALERLSSEMESLDKLEQERISQAEKIELYRKNMVSISGSYTKAPPKTINEYQKNPSTAPGAPSHISVQVENPKYKEWTYYESLHTPAIEAFKALIEEYLGLQDQLNTDINFVINFGTTIMSFDSFLKIGLSDGGVLSSKDNIVAHNDDIVREMTDFWKYPVITDPDIDFPDGTVVYYDDDPYHKYVVTGSGYDDNGHYTIIQAIDPVTGKVIPGSEVKIYDIREISKPQGEVVDPVVPTLPTSATKPSTPPGPNPTRPTSPPGPNPTKPTKPTKPTEPETRPTNPPTQPTVRPTVPPTQPTVPHTEPTIPPTTPHTDPVIIIPTFPTPPPIPTVPIDIPTLPPVIPTIPTGAPNTGIEGGLNISTNKESAIAAGAGLGLAGLGLGLTSLLRDDEEEKEKEEKDNENNETKEEKEKVGE